jgi:hypothetical protein
VRPDHRRLEAAAHDAAADQAIASPELPFRILARRALGNIRRSGNPAGCPGSALVASIPLALARIGPVEFAEFNAWLAVRCSAARRRHVGAGQPSLAGDPAPHRAGNPRAGARN